MDKDKLKPNEETTELIKTITYLVVCVLSVGIICASVFGLIGWLTGTSMAVSGFIAGMVFTLLGIFIKLMKLEG